MKISSEILYRKLRAEFAFAVFGAEGSELVFERPLFLRDGKNLKDDQIYITEEAMIQTKPSVKTRSVLLYIGLNPEEFICLFDAVFVFRGVSLFDLYDAVQNIYSEYEEWDTSLRQILESGGDVQKMIDCSVSVFNNPLVLYDKNFTTLAFSEKYSADPMVIPLMEKRRFAGFMNTSDFSEAYSKRKAAIFSPCIAGVRSLYINISPQGKFQYRLMTLEFSRKFNPSDTPLLDHLANGIQLALSGGLSDAADTGTALSSVMKSLLTGDVSEAEPHYAEQRLNEFGWYGEQRFFCVKILPDVPDRRGRNLHSFCVQLREVMANSCVFEYENGIAVIVNRGNSEEDSDTVFSGLVPVLEESGLRAGVSRRFTGFGEFKQYFKQAELALSLGSRGDRLTRLHHFADIITPLLLDSCVRELPASMVCAPELIILKNYDAEHKTEYFHTMESFLQNNLHPVQTIKELNIHRSTLIYRLERIQKLTGLDLVNCDNQWYLLLSFKMLEYAG